jgi:Flp pilus assembly protein TadD
MLRTITFLTTSALATLAFAAKSPAVDFDMAQVCFQAASESTDLEISDRIIGYCSTALAEAKTPEASAAILNNRAILRIRQDNRAAAKTDLTEAIRIHPADIDARMTLGYLAWLEGDLAAAESAYTDALATNPMPLAAFNRGIIRRQRGDIVGAMRDALTAAGHSPESVEKLLPSSNSQER